MLLTSSQSFVNFANTFLLPSVEIKTKYLFPLFSSIYLSASPMIRYNGFTLLRFSYLSIFYCYVTNIIDPNIFVGLFVYFY